MAEGGYETGKGKSKLGRKAKALRENDRNDLFRLGSEVQIHYTQELANGGMAVTGESGEGELEKES